MPEEIRPAHQIGEQVYRRWTHPGKKSSDPEAFWYESYQVDHLTDKYVFVTHPLLNRNLRLKRSSLERSGFAVHYTEGAIFVHELPDDYRKQTLGYLMDQKPREILGLGDRFTATELRDAYRRRARETHPDTGGAIAEFRQVHAAYERLSDPHTLGQILHGMGTATDDE